jgi:hypothetical protein
METEESDNLETNVSKNKTCETARRQECRESIHQQGGISKFAQRTK